MLWEGPKLTSDPEKVFKVHTQWDALLAEMVFEYHIDHPDDCRTDIEIAIAILEKLVTVGVVRKNEEGKYILPVLLLH
jgi:hypothetical protein